VPPAKASAWTATSSPKPSRPDPIPCSDRAACSSTWPPTCQSTGSGPSSSDTPSCYNNRGCSTIPLRSREMRGCLRAYKAHLNLTTDGIKTMPDWAIDKKGDKSKIEGFLSNELTTSEICVVLRSGNLIYLRSIDAYSNDCWSGKKDTSEWKSLYVLESSQLIGTWKR
jgi:hypothetical protein